MPEKKTNELPSRARSFIRCHIQSVWQLELLLFAKNNGSKLTIEETSRALYTEQNVIAAGVDSFVNAGLFYRDSDQKFAYAPNSKFAGTVAELATLYNERRTAVIQFIYASPMKSFSDAFSIKPEAEEQQEEET